MTSMEFNLVQALWFSMTNILLSMRVPKPHASYCLADGSHQFTFFIYFLTQKKEMLSIFIPFEVLLKSNDILIIITATNFPFHLPLTDTISINFQEDIVCKDHNQRSSTSIPRPGNEVCLNLTAVDGSCDFCGTQTTDPEYPCSLGCISLPHTTTRTTETTNEFIEPGSCEWYNLWRERVWELPDFFLSVVQLWQTWAYKYYDINTILCPLIN